MHGMRSGCGELRKRGSTVVKVTGIKLNKTGATLVKGDALTVGHVPVLRLNETMTNTFYRTRYYMDIDSGSGFREQGGVLGCYCVTTDAEIYM